jgi:hypothetical protein
MSWSSGLFGNNPPRMYNPEQDGGSPPNLGYDEPNTLHTMPYNPNDATIDMGMPGTGNVSTGGNGQGGMQWLQDLIGGGSGGPAGNGGADGQSWLTQIFGDGSNGGLFGGNGMNAVSMAGLASALKMFNDSGQYQKTAEDASKMANPFGDRSYYVDRLKQSYMDPNSILNDPGHKALVARGLDAVDRSASSQGNQGNGGVMAELTKYAQDTDATYLSDERKNLANLAGAQFNPAESAKILMEGNNQKINSQNGALAALMAPFMAQMGQNRVDNTTKKTPMDTGSITKALATASSPNDIIKTLSGLASMGGHGVGSLIQQVLSSPDLSESTRSILTSMQNDPQYEGLFTTGGGTDLAPPGYSDGNPFGGFTNPDGSLNWQAIFQNGGPDLSSGGGQDMTGFNQQPTFGGETGDSFSGWLDSLYGGNQ